MMLSALPWKGQSRFASVFTLHDYSLRCAKKTLLYNEGRHCWYHLGRRCTGCAPQMYGKSRGLAVSAGLAFGRQLFRDVDLFIARSTAVHYIYQSDRIVQNRPMVTIPNFIAETLMHGPALAPLPARLWRSPPPAPAVLNPLALVRERG